MGYLEDIEREQKPTYAEKTIARQRNSEKTLTALTTHSSAIFVSLLMVVGIVCTLIAGFSTTSTINIRSITISGIIFSAVVYTIFIECTQNGKKQYINSKEKTATDSEYLSLIKDIEEKNIAYKIEQFCELYTEDKLNKARKRVLSRSKLTLNDYDLFISEQGEFTKKQIKTLKKAQKIKPIHLNEDMLYHASFDNIDGSPIRSSNGIIAYIVLKYIYKFITTVASLFFTFSIGYEIITNLTPEVIMRSVLQITIMISTIFGGLKFGAIQMQKWNDQKKDIIRVLKIFKRWEEQGKLDNLTAKNE